MAHQVVFRGITEIWLDEFEGRSISEVETRVAQELEKGRFRGEDYELFSDILPDCITDWEYAVIDSETGERGEWITAHDKDSENWRG